MAVLRRTERSQWSLRPRLYSERHSDDPLLDRDDEYLGAGFTYAYEKVQWSASVDFSNDTTLTSELGLTGLVEDNRRHEGITATAGPTFSLSERTTAGVQAYWNDNHYRDARFTGLVDYEYGAVAVFSKHVFSERTELSVKARVGEMRVPANPLADKQDATLTLGWRYEPWPLWTLDLAAGSSYARSESGTDDGMVFNVGMQRRAERWTFSTSGGRDVIPTGRGALTRRDQLSISASRALTERLSASFSVRGVRNQELLTQSGLPAQQLKYGRVDLRLGWQFAEHWNLSAGIGGTLQRVSSRPDGAENQGASLSIVWNGQPQYL